MQNKKKANLGLSSTLFYAFCGKTTNFPCLSPLSFIVVASLGDGQFDGFYSVLG